MLIEFLDEGLVDFLEFFALFQNGVNPFSYVFHLTFETGGLFLFLENGLQFRLVLAELFIVFLFHGLDEVQEELISLGGVFSLCLKDGLIVADCELNLVLK